VKLFLKDAPFFFNVADLSGPMLFTHAWPVVADDDVAKDR
jgi:hypothetical protein